MSGIAVIKMILKNLLFSVFIIGILLPGDVVAKPAKRKPAVSRPHYIYSENGVYYYEAAITRAERAAGKVANDAVGYRFYGKNVTGEFVLARVSGNDYVEFFAYCKNPCRVIRFSDGDRVVNKGGLLVSLAISDAIRGLLRNTNPDRPKPRSAPVSIPSIAPVHRGALFNPTRTSSGVAIRTEVNAPVYATADGVVSYIGPRKSDGTIVTINHGAEVESLYGRLARIAVARNASVKRGDLIGYVASARAGIEPGLIYEIRIGGVAVNPIPYLSGDPEFRELFRSWQEK